LEAYKKNAIAMQALDRYRDARDRETRASTRGSKVKQELHDPPKRPKIEEETGDDADILAKPTSLSTQFRRYPKYSITSRGCGQWCLRP
jgi:hypothetical protein